jgi:hypothetical protein
MAAKKKAPAGYHFMPNGKLMKDSDHGKDNAPKKRQAKQAVHRKYNKDKQFYKA